MRIPYQHLLIFILLAATSIPAFGQISIKERRSTEHRAIKIEQNSLTQFKTKVDEFISAIGDEDISTARRLKGEILNSMKLEIQATREMYRAEQRESQKNGGQGVDEREREYVRSSYKFDRRRRHQTNINEDLAKRLDTQIKIATKLKNLYLDPSYNYWVKAREHESLMHKFEQTMRNNSAGLRRD